MVQTLIVTGLFIAAAFWMGRRFYQAIWGVEGKCDRCAMSKVARQNQITTSRDK